MDQPRCGFEPHLPNKNIQIKLVCTFNLDEVWYFNSKNISLSEKIQVTSNPDQTIDALSTSGLSHHPFTVESRVRIPSGRLLHKLNQEKHNDICLAEIVRCHI